MSKQQKLLRKLCTKPPPGDLHWDDLCTILKRLGYTLINNCGARRKFHHAERNLLVICHEPHPHPYVDKNCIKDVVEHLTINGLLGSNSSTESNQDNGDD